jgi:hypothetical protein
LAEKIFKYLDGKMKEFGYKFPISEDISFEKLYDIADSIL